MHKYRPGWGFATRNEELTALIGSFIGTSVLILFDSDIERILMLPIWIGVALFVFGLTALGTKAKCLEVKEFKLNPSEAISAIELMLESRKILFSKPQNDLNNKDPSKNRATLSLSNLSASITIIPAFGHIKRQYSTIKIGPVAESNRSTIRELQDRIENVLSGAVIPDDKYVPDEYRAT